MMEDIEFRLLEYVDRNADRLFESLRLLIAFDTQNFITHGNEYECQKYIKTLYEKLGLETQLYYPDDLIGIKQHPGYLAGRGTDRRPNVSGVWQGSGKDHPVMLAAHTDTMPVGDISKWTVDPFGGAVKDGRIYGLGAGDNKFGIAAAMFAVEALIKNGISLQKPVVLTAYCDEEYGGGDGALAACLKYPCETIVNLDGGNYELWTAALGGGGFKITVCADFVTDTAVHVIDALYEVRKALTAFEHRRKTELHLNAKYKGSDMERSALRIMGFEAGSFGSNLDCGTLSFVIYTDEAREEIIAELQEIERKIKPYLDAHRLRTEGFVQTTRFFDYAETADDTGAAALLKKAAEETSGKPVKECGACLSDLSVFLKYGCPNSFNFGILRDFSLYGGAHQPDEFIECDQFINHTKALILFLLRFCKAK